MKRFLSIILISIMSLGLFGCVNTNTTTDSFSFSDLANVEFIFTSGAGAWGTVLRIDEKGNFVGEFSDAEMGAGEYYLSNFSGQFKNPVKVNDYTYSLTISNLEYEKEVGTKEQKEDFLYIYSEAFGIANAEEILLYLPEAPHSELPEDYKSWVMYQIMHDPENAEELGFYGLYNEDTQCGFYSYEF